MTGLAFQPWGHYALALAASVECFHVKPWTRTATTADTLRLGTEAAPEFACLSFKASTGHFIQAAREGVAYGVMVNSRGTCRLRYYRELQQRILKERGLDLFVFGLGYDGIKPPLIRHFNPGLLDFLRCCVRARLKVLAVDGLETLAWRTRARERRAGATTRALNDALAELDRRRTAPEIRAFRRDIPARFAAVETDPNRIPLRVGLIGEATVLRDAFLNQNVEELLGELGVEVRNFFLLGEEMSNILKLSFWSPHSMRALARLARPYLKTPVGGHALHSVAHTIRCAREGYDGLVHICPSGCMPEISVRPILKKVSADLAIPVLELSFDEHSSRVGVVTRLEAFVDVLLDRRTRKKT